MKLTPVGGSNNDGLFRVVNGTIWFRKYREGKGEICRSCKTRDLSLARRKREELMAELWGDAPKMQRRQTMGELWPTWSRGKAETKSPATAASIDSSWKNLQPYVAGLFPDEATEDWWLTVYIPRKREEISSKTKRSNPKRKFANDRKWLLAFLSHLKRQDILPKVPKLINPDPVREKGRAYTKEETDAMIQAADWLFVPKLVMALEHFMRRSEIALLEKAWVDRKNRVINLPAWVCKTRYARRVPFNERLELLFQCLDEKHEGLNSPFVFPSPNDPMKPIARDGFMTAWKGCKARAGIAGKANFHWLRHTGLTRAFKSPGVNVAKVCAVGGLDVQEAMDTYVHFQLEDLRGVENLVVG
jgi:integrase